MKFLAVALVLAFVTVACVAASGVSPGDAIRIAEEDQPYQLPIPEKVPSTENLAFRVVDQELRFFHEKIQRLWNGENFTDTTLIYTITTNKEINLQSVLWCDDFDFIGAEMSSRGKMIVNKPSGKEFTDTAIISSNNLFDAEKIICGARTEALGEYKIISQINETFFESEYQFPTVESVNMYIEDNQLFTEIFVTENQTNAISGYTVEIGITHFTGEYEGIYEVQDFPEDLQSYLNLTFNKTITETSEGIYSVYFGMNIYSGIETPRTQTFAINEYRLPLNTQTTTETIKLIPTETTKTEEEIKTYLEK